MTTLTETRHAFGFLMSEANFHRSSDNIIVVSGQNLGAGAVIAKTVTAGTVTGAAVAGNIGNGTIGTLSAGGAAKVGAYRVTFVEPAANLGDFIVEDPDGVNVGNGVVGTAFSGPVVFTITDGSTDMAAGDQFAVTVSQLTGEKWLVLTPAGTNGSQFAAGILGAAVDASAADAAGVVISRSAEINGNELVWPGSITAAEKSVAIAQLAALGIIIR